MRDDIVFEELIEKIDLILNSSKPLPYHMKDERKLAEVLNHLQEIPEYDNLKQFEALFDVEPFLIHFLVSADYTDLLKIIDRSTMKFKHIDDYTHLMALVVNPNIPFFEKTVVVDRMLEMGEGIDVVNANGETALMMAVKRNNRKMIEYLLEKGASPNIPDDMGITPLMVATYNNQLYNMALLHYYGAFAGDVCAEYEFDAFDIADRGYISEYQSIRDSSSCHLVDEKNINKYVSETDNKRGDIEVIGILKNISAIDGRLILDPCFYIKKHNSNSSSSSKSSYNTPQISSNLTLDISKPVYEKNENIALLAQWIGPDVDCKILEEKVKETLVSRHFEIVENSLSCAGNDNKSLIQLRVQFKSPRIGKLNIPSINLDNVSGNSVDFSVRDLEALQNAVASKNTESIKAFLSSPSDLDEIKIDGEHPVAHFIKDDMTFAQELIKLEASADVIDKNGYTPLMYAVIRQDNDFLDLLLKKKVYLNEVDKKGRTAIMYAAIKNNLYAAQKLIEHRADLYKSKDKKWSAYKYAKEMGHKDIAKLLDLGFDELIIFTDSSNDSIRKKEILKKFSENYTSLRLKYLPLSSLKIYIPEKRYIQPTLLLFDSKKETGRYIPDWDGDIAKLQKLMVKD